MAQKRTPLPISARIAGCWLLILLAAACTVPGPSEMGTLAGHVTVGPLQPVEIAGYPQPTPPPEVYEGREVVIFDADGRRELTRAPIDGNGNYQIELTAGTYMVDINHLGIDLAKDLPQTIQIIPEQTTQLNIAIDTGIR